ncbi:ATP-binding cassette domain-containing protein [Flavobacteriaceae bacterium]|nr:ATP-binding cassette domain-containing protein [Flavobacteriaceae bacterium]
MILSIKGLTKKYGDKTALNSIDLDIEKGKIFGLIGQNGAGKTSLIRIINQIINYDSGTIDIDNKPLSEKSILKIGYLPEERGLYKNMTILEQALYFGQLKNMTKKEVSTELNYWLNKFDIQGWKNKKIQGLSKGMAQKVQFIIAVLHKPTLLILDEPFSGFDPLNALTISKEIKELANKGTTIVFSSHRMESVEDMCDDMCLLHNGSILLKGNINQIQKEHQEESYRVSLENCHLNSLENFINANENYSVLNNINETTTIEVVNPNISSSKLLSNFQEFGEVVFFQKHIPSLQDIFIKTIANA